MLVEIQDLALSILQELIMLCRGVVGLGDLQRFLPVSWSLSRGKNGDAQLHLRSKNWM